MKRKLGFSFLVCFLSLSCVPKIDSPFSDIPQTSIRNYNQYNINKLNPNLSLKFAIISDSHQNYSDLNQVINYINHLDVNFVLNTGDFTNIGSNVEYDIFVNQILKFNKPFITTIGNHDIQGQGLSLYNQIFGPDNYSFDFKGYRFVLFNNNFLDMQNIDLDWLNEQLQDSPFPIIIVQHINISEEEYYPGVYDKVLETYNNSKIFLVLNGHKHGFDDEVKNGYLTHQTARTEGSQYSIVSISEGVINVQNCVANSCTNNSF